MKIHYDQQYPTIPNAADDDYDEPMASAQNQRSLENDAWFRGAMHAARRPVGDKARAFVASMRQGQIKPRISLNADGIRAALWHCHSDIHAVEVQWSGFTAWHFLTAVAGDCADQMMRLCQLADLLVAGERLPELVD